MIARTKPHWRLTAGEERASGQHGVGIERLETRTLLSGWATVDSLPPPATGMTAAVLSMTADGAGNVYAAGSYNGQGLLRVKAGGSSGFVTVATPVAPGSAVGSIFADGQGDLFITGGSGPIFERRAGQPTFAPVPVNVPSGASYVLFGPPVFAADAAGDVFAVGMVTTVTGTTTSHGVTTTTYSKSGTIFEMKAGQTSFSPVYQESSSTFAPYAITLIDGGPSAGIYVIDAATPNVIVRKSTDGGTSWSKASSPSAPLDYAGELSIAGDSSGNGNLYVVGKGTQSESVLTGYTYTKVKGKTVQTPVYTTYSHALTEQSGDGGATWTVVDNVTSTSYPRVYAVADLNGTVYVAGQTGQGPGDGIVRSNAGGSWQTVDDTGGSVYQTLTIDPATGTPYAGGIWSLNGPGAGWSVRSGPPLGATPVTPASATFSTTMTASSPVQSTSQFGRIFPESATFSDGSRLVDQLFGDPAKKGHAHAY